MDFIVNKVVQLKEVHNADGYGIIEFLSCASVEQSDLAVVSQKSDL